ncbi:MAG: hypothetical protein JNK29_10100 [Anaerolineales bacterium]|nr:hypothetical protein [Anaerolineales bacterium]
MRAPSPSARWWATLSLISGGVWLALSLAPFFVTTLLGLPFAALALVGGWLGRRAADPADPGAGRRAKWGLGLGCAGCLWQIAYFTLLGGALIAGLPSLVEYLRKTLTP